MAWITTANFINNLFYASAWGTAYSMYSEIFPTHVRSTGIGLAVGFGRLGGFFAPLLTAWAYDEGGKRDVFGGLMGFRYVCP